LRGRPFCSDLNMATCSGSSLCIWLGKLSSLLCRAIGCLRQLGRLNTAVTRFIVNDNYNYKKSSNNNNKKSHSNNKYINVNACQCFPAHDELGKCRASLVSPEPVLCIPICPRLMYYRLDPGRTLSKNYRYTFSPVLWFWSHFQLSVVLLTLFCSAAAMCTIVWLRLKRFILLRLVCS